MPIYKQFDVVVVPFPFTNSQETKRRPALVLSDHAIFKIDKTVLAMITTIEGKTKWSLDTEIKDLEATGIKTSSMIRFKLFTLDNRLIIKKIGSLSGYDRSVVNQRMKKLFKIQT